jgi:uncharacterized protein YutE (UPF0331/DUF86 family)
MELEIYQKETELITHRQTAILDAVRDKMKKGEKLSPMEENGVLHSLQLLIENAIGKGKHILKSIGVPIPVSAYEVFKELDRNNRIDGNELEEWMNIIGLRNKIVHDYMNIDFKIIFDIIKRQRYRFVVKFLLKPFG